MFARTVIALECSLKVNWRWLWPKCHRSTITSFCMTEHASWGAQESVLDLFLRVQETIGESVSFKCCSASQDLKLRKVDCNRKTRSISWTVAKWFGQKPRSKLYILYYLMIGSRAAGQRTWHNYCRTSKWQTHGTGTTQNTTKIGTPVSHAERKAIYILRSEIHISYGQKHWGYFV